MPRSQSLHSFQERLLRRLSGTQAQTKESGLSLSMGDERWFVQLQSSGEILTLPSITPVPLTHPWFLGLANIRGKLYGVTDLMAFFDRGLTPINGRARLMLLNSHLQESSAILVSLSPGFHSNDAFVWHPPQPESPRCITGTAQDSQGTVWQFFNPAALLQEKKYLNAFSAAEPRSATSRT